MSAHCIILYWFKRSKKLKIHLKLCIFAWLPFNLCHSLFSDVYQIFCVRCVLRTVHWAVPIYQSPEIWRIIQPISYNPNEIHRKFWLGLERKTKFDGSSALRMNIEGVLKHFRRIGVCFELSNEKGCNEETFASNFVCVRVC